MSAKKSIGHADALWGRIDEVISTGREATVKKFVLHRIAIIVAAIAVGSAGIATDALARGGGGGGHGGGFAHGAGFAHGSGRGGVVRDPTTLLGAPAPRMPAFENRIPAPLAPPPQAPIINGPCSSGSCM